jgi:Flp pilus assembly protein protease CpaA
MNVLDSTSGWMAWALSLLLFTAVGGAVVSSAILIIRVVKKTKNWANSAETKKERVQRWVGLAIGYLFSLPFIYLWFAMVTLVGGFLSIAIQQRQTYH